MPPTASAAPAELEALRAAIERADEALIAALAQRMTLARRVGSCKRSAGLPVLDPAREAAVVRRAAALARRAGLPEDEVRAIYWRILAMSRRVQQGGDR
jgi:chorismate mutase